jgi:hypothetical protein
MNKKYIMSAAAAMVLGVVACADMPTMSPDDALMKRGQGQGAGQGGETGQNYNGPTWVLGEFALTIEGVGESFDPGENAHPQGKGTCKDGTGEVNGDKSLNVIWHAPGNDRADTSAKFCAGSEEDGEPIVLTCTIDAPGIPATYAANGNSPGRGNENLNFVTDGDVDLFVHYKDNSNSTDAAGILELAYSCDLGVEGSASIDLGDWAGPGNLFIDRDAESRQLKVEGHTVVTDLGDGALKNLYWTFRSRVGG